LGAAVHPIRAMRALEAAVITKGWDSFDIGWTDLWASGF
jgi:hypothetical protein